MVSPEEIIHKIHSLQSVEHIVYNTGLFPSQRLHPLTRYSKEDNNVFFSALVAFTLQQLDRIIPADLVVKTRSIREAVISNYSKYRHYADPDTYNFWENKRSGHFPNGWILHRIPMMALPADTDDTSIIYLTMPNSGNLDHLKNKLESHYPNNSPISPLTPKAYKDLRAYPTFLGEKILREMDACVICNVLYFVCQYALNWTQVDNDSVTFLTRVLQRKDYEKSPFGVSPNYGSSSVILYHIARLVGTFDHGIFDSLKVLLRESLTMELAKDQSFMECLLTKTSLLRMGIKTPPLNIPENLDLHFHNYYFFQAGMLTGFQKSFLTPLAQRSFFHLKFKCQAYYYTLLLEYLLLADKDYSKS